MGFRRIRRRLLLPALVVGVSLAGLAVLHALQARNTQIELAKANTLAVARSTALSLDATIAGTRTLLFGIRELAKLHLPRAVNDSILARTKAGSTIPIADLRFFDTTGVLLGASNYQNHGPAPPGMLRSPMFQKARASRAFTVGSVRRAMTLPDTPHLLSVTLPVLDSATHAVVAFVGAAILIDSLGSVQALRRLSDSSVLTLMDTLGTVTYRSLDTDRWLGRAYGVDSGMRTDLRLRERVGYGHRSDDGIVRLVGSERLQEASWMLYLGVPVAPTLRIAQHELMTDLVVGGLLVMLVLWFCYRSAIGVVEPIESLTEDVSAIADGEMTRRSPIDSNDELGDLGRAFNRMADTITERGQALRESQERLLHAQKLEALGQLAGGIAHDFNNYLHVIMAHAGIVQSSLAPGTEERADVDAVLAAADRAASLTRQILVFSRKQVVEPRVVDLNAAIRSVERMLVRVASDDRVLSHTLSTDCIPVLIDAGAFEQVMVNLVANARDATRTAGRIEVATHVEPVAQDEAGATQSRAIVTVSDDGDGMPAAVRERIFDPFFTTKPRGHGTGLGLAIAYGIVNQAGGTITVKSAPGSGTTFRISLPISRDSAAAAVATLAPTPIARGDGVVLVVDDDPEVLRSTQRMIEQAGYRAVAVGDGAAALAVLEREPVIDLLLTDVIMPGLPGPSLAAAARARHPTLPVLFMTGYAEDDALLRDFGARTEQCIRKPFTMVALSTAIRDALERRAAVASSQ